MSNTTETLISQEPNNFTSQVSINNKIQQLPFNFPDDLLPDALKNNNPLAIWRKVNGVLTK